jgi:arylsulfatase
MYERIDEIGGPLSHNNYPWGWTMAGNTPFKRWKREVHEGGVADPCIVRLPAARRAAAGGGLRRQYAHAIDITPTLLELVGLAPPTEIDGIAQTHLDGTSFAHLLGEGGEDEAGRHRTQHFEMLGSRAIYHDGWKAVTYHPVGPIYDDGLRSNAPWDDDVWELYHVAEDVSESRDRAAEFPEKVAELVALWWEEARRNDVLPLDNRVLDVIAHKHDHRRLQSTYRYFQDGAPVPEWVAVDTRNRSHDIALTIEVPDGAEPSGTLLALGCALGGWSLHVIGGRLRYLHNLHGQRLYEVAAASELGPGRHEVVFRFEKDDFLGGRATLLQDGTAVGSGEVKRFTPVAFNELMIGLTCGYEWGPAVGGDYEAPFAFNGTIVRAEVTATGPVVRDPVAEVAAILASQ